MYCVYVVSLHIDSTESMIPIFGSLLQGLPSSSSRMPVMQRMPLETWMADTCVGSASVLSWQRTAAGLSDVMWLITHPEVSVSFCTTGGCSGTLYMYHCDLVLILQCPMYMYGSLCSH